MDDTTDADLKVSYSVTSGYLITRRNAVKVDGGQVDSSAAAAPTALTASVVSTPATGDTYKRGEQIRVALDFDGAVVVKGTPQITLYLGTNGRANNNYRWADYDSAPSTARRLVFSYTVQEADYTNALEIMTAHFNLNGGAIRASADEREANIHRANSSGTGGKVDSFLGVSTPTVPAVSSVKVERQVQAGAYYVAVTGEESEALESGDTFARNETISVGVKFSPRVRVTRGNGRPVLALSIGTQVREAYYAYTAPYGDLVFTYRVQAADRDLDGLSIAVNALTLVGNRSIVHARSATTAADLSLGSSSVSNDARYKVDGSAVKPATVERFYLTSRPCLSSVLELGCRVQVGVAFDQAIEVTGRPQLTLTIGTQTRRVDYSGGGYINGVNRILYFYYIVQASDRDTDGVSVAQDALSLNGGSIVVAGSKVPANLKLRRSSEIITPPVDGSRITAPSLRYLNIVPGSSGDTGKPAHDGTYRLGDEIRATARFSRYVVVTGTPQVAVVIGSQTRQMNLCSPVKEGGVTVASLSFCYSVQATDRDSDGISIARDAFSVNGGAIVIAGGTTAANLTFPWTPYSNDTRYKVDGSTRTDSLSLRASGLAFSGSPANGDTYRLGEEVRVAVTFDHDVTVTGEPQLPLTLTMWPWARRATYQAALSTPRRLVFTYTVEASDRDTDGLSVPLHALSTSRVFVHNAGRIRKTGTSSVPLFVRSPRVAPDPARKVDGSYTNPGGGGTNPGGGGPNPGGGSNPEPSLRVSRVTFTGTPASEETYRLGEQIRVAVTFSEAVTVTGTPQIGLTVGAATRQAAYDATRSKGTLLTFTYTVQATDADADGISIAANAMTLNGGTISLASDTTAAALGHNAVATDDTRKVDGSTDVVEHGDSREQATLLTLTERTTGEVGETGGDEGFQINVGTARSAEAAGAVEQAGDADYFRVEVPGAGRLTVQTTGTTDTGGALQGATGQTLTEDDNGGTGSNFRVERQVQAGTYYVAVTGGESEQGIGLYTLSVRFTPVGGGTTVGEVVPPSGSGSPPAGSTPPDGGEPGDGEAGQPAPLRLNTETTGTLEQAGEVDYFRVEVEEAGTLTVEATGAAAPVAYFGAGDEPLLHQSAAQSANGRSREEPGGAAWPVTAGTYHVAVVGGAARTQTGAYTVAVRFTAASEVGPLQATLLNLSPSQAWVHFYCRRAQQSEAAACTAQVQCGQGDGPPVAWAVEVAPETIHTYWPGQTRADGTPDDLAAALIAAGMAEADARQRTTCRVFSPDPLDVRAYTRVGQDVVPVASPPAPVDATAPARVATLLNVAPAHAWVHLSCQKTLAPDAETVDPCAVRLQCGQQAGPPVAWEVEVAAETTVTYGPGGTAGDLAAALVAAGKSAAEARQRATCQVFSRDPVDAWAYTRIAGEVVSVANPPAAVDAAAPTRVTTLQNLAPADAWVHFYCRKPYRSDAETADPCTVRLQCGQRDGAPVAWDVAVAPETIFTYWPGRTAADGTRADFEAALIAAGKAEAEARRRTTCQVFSTDPVDVRGYTRLGGEVVPVANPPIMPTADTPTRIGTLLNLAPAHAWVHFYCRKAQHPDAETIEPCNVRLQCGQRDGASVAWGVEVAPETLFSYWPGRTTPEGTSDNLAAALIAAGKTEAEARRRTTCQVFSTDPVDVRGYTRLGETIVPVKN